jgi:hypothetical protein
LLAEALGKTVKELLSEISSSEITEWIAYFSLKTGGEIDAKIALSNMFSSRIKKKGG